MHRADGIAVRTTRPAGTLALGEVLGGWARAGDVFAFDGPLGSGKTQLVKGLALGLGVSSDTLIVSPTFVLVREYAGRLPLYHIDAYRLSSADEAAALGFEELREAGGVVAIEWPDRLAGLVPASATTITLAYANEPDTRDITIRVDDARRFAQLARALSDPALNSGPIP